jgi:hypothetical protein
MASGLSPRGLSKLRVAITPSLVSRTAYRSFSSPILVSPTRLVGESFLSGTPPPPTPSPWLWKCHKCHRKYRLDVTRRCLRDGHYFCHGPLPRNSFEYAVWQAYQSGCTNTNWPGCTIRFDEAGWKSWGEWRRKEIQLREMATGRPQHMAGRSTHDCWHDCDSPSDCLRTAHEKRTVGARTGCGVEASCEMDVSPDSPPDSDSDSADSSDSSCSSSSTEDYEDYEELDDTSPTITQETLFDTISLELEDWPQPPRSHPTHSIARKALPNAIPKMPDLDVDEAELNWYRCLARFVEDGDSQSTKDNEADTWNWTVGGLESLQQQGMGLAGEMLNGV